MQTELATLFLSLWASNLLLGLFRGSFSSRQLFVERLPALMTRISHLWTSSFMVYLEDLWCSPENAGHAEVIAFAVLTWTELHTWLLVFPRPHPKTRGEKSLLLQPGVACLWGPLHATMFLKGWTHLPSWVLLLCVFMCGRGGVARSPRSLGQSRQYPTFSLSVRAASLHHVPPNLSYCVITWRPLPALLCLL